MSTPSPAVNGAPESAKDKLAGHDEKSDTTFTNTGFKPKANKAGMTSKVFKFSFVFSGSTKNKVAHIVIQTHPKPSRMRTAMT
jgi:hypothetical protein